MALDEMLAMQRSPLINIDFGFTEDSSSKKGKVEGSNTQEKAVEGPNYWKTQRLVD